MQKTEKDRKRPNFIQKKYKTRQNATRKNTERDKTRQNATNLFLEKFGRKKKRIEQSINKQNKIEKNIKRIFYGKSTEIE